MSNHTLQPRIQIIPDRAAVCTSKPIELTVLVRVTPPEAVTTRERPPINVSLVIDRSGSMAGESLRAAKEAAIFAVNQLSPRDRVSVVTYDDKVETVVDSTYVKNIAAIENEIRRIESGGSTALHDGWLRGGQEVARHLDPRALNRVILLTDGLANVGETNPDRIVRDVRGLAKRGVTTTCMGFGHRFDDVLLIAMADAGEGNYGFVEGAAMLEAFFATELHGLMATTGTKVSLGLEPRTGARVKEVFNDLERNCYGRLQLRDMLAGQPLEVVARIKVDPGQDAREVLRVRLAWTDPLTGERCKLRELLSLPAVSEAKWAALPQNEEVLEKRASLELARIRQRAAEALDAGDREIALGLAEEGTLVALSAMAPHRAAAEVASFNEFTTDVRDGRELRASKTSRSRSYNERTSR